MKKILLVVTLLALPVVAFAQGFVPLAPIPGLTEGVAADTAGLAAFFNNLYKFAIGLAATLAVIEIIWGGLEISTQDSVSKNQKGKERIQNAIFGLILVLSPVLVFSLINPNILNLSLNLPPINLTTAPGVGAGTQGPAVTDAATGCSVSGGDYLKTVVCPSENAANSFSCPTGLTTKSIPFCKNFNPNTKLCEATDINVSCSGKILDIIVYHTTASGGFFQRVSDDLTIPRDVPAENAYNSGCSADGGKAAKNLVTINTIPCPLDAAIPNFNANTGQVGVGCLNARLTCTP